MASLCAIPVSLLLLGFVAGSALRAQEKATELQQRFDREGRGSGKAKLLGKLQEAQFEDATQAEKAGDFAAVGLIFEKYRDNVRSAFALLKKQEPDADRHPGGYRQLELHVRQGLREVDDTLVAVPREVRPPLQIVRQDLSDMDDALIRELFPRRTREPVKAPPEDKPEDKP